MLPTVNGQLVLDWDALPEATLPQLLTPDEMYQQCDADFFLNSVQENRKVERKPVTISTDLLAEYYSMWANTAPDGGLIVLGIEDKTTRVIGCAHADEHHINEIEKSHKIKCTDARPVSRYLDTTNHKGKSDYLILIRVPYNENKVVRTNKGEAFHRCGDSKFRLTEDVIRELEIDKGQVPFEREAIALSYPNDFDMPRIREFGDKLRAMSNAVLPLSDEQALEARRLGKIKDGFFRPTIACALAFAKDPTDRFPGCKVRFLRYPGTEERTGDQYFTEKDVTIEGNVPHIIEKTAEFLESQLREFSRLGPDGKFYTVPEYPRFVWFEALVNACVHRSYSIHNMNIFIKMFDDRLEVESPGGFPPLVTELNLYDMPRPRNPDLMNAMNIIGYVKAINEGTKRMRRMMVDAELPAPEFRQVGGDSGSGKVVVTLRNNRVARALLVEADVSKVLGDELTRSLTPNERLVVSFIKKNDSISVSQCLRQVPRCNDWRGANKLLQSMVHRGILSLKPKRDRARNEFVFRPLDTRDPQPPPIDKQLDL